MYVIFFIYNILYNDEYEEYDDDDDDDDGDDKCICF